MLAFEPVAFARFALSEFDRGLVGLTEQEAGLKLKKADGTQMNSIAHTVGHIAWHWHRIREYATGETYPVELKQFAFGSPAEGAPPPLATVLGYLQQARDLSWLENVDAAFLSAGTRAENVAVSVTRVSLHTWFHTGEINAIRQMLGHTEIIYTGDVLNGLPMKFMERQA